MIESWLQYFIDILTITLVITIRIILKVLILCYWYWSNGVCNFTNGLDILSGMHFQFGNGLNDEVIPPRKEQSIVRHEVRVVSRVSSFVVLARFQHRTGKRRSSILRVEQTFEVSRRFGEFTRRYKNRQKGVTPLSVAAQCPPCQTAITLLSMVAKIVSNPEQISTAK